MKYQNIREEELKNKVAHDFFWIYDCTKIIGNVDFCVCMQESDKQLFEQESLLWAEAKAGKSDIYNSLVQLILTIGKARTFDKHLPPPFLGAFDAEKIAFIPYSEINEIFYLNDFNWNVTPSNYETKEFKLIHEKVNSIIDKNALLFNFDKDKNELIKFIRQNFKESKRGITKTRIDKNNFMIVYNKWLSEVKNTIALNWDIAKKTGIIDGDFYLADLLSENNKTLKDKLFVLLQNDKYVLDRKLNDMGLFTSSSVEFTDNQKAHNQFWNRYERPPKEEYWEYIVSRRDLLVPQDVRERKGSFYTPQIWVELSQKYLADTLGENWQDEYYIWDCAAGTGNLLNGLTNKYNIWASTLDKQDVEVMKDRIKNGANLLENHVFQFDFLNDDFKKLPEELYKIINDPEKRKKLVMYINPPYAEASNRDTVFGIGANKSSVSTNTIVYKDNHIQFGTATRELYAQFIIRIFKNIPNAKLAQFSKLKILQAPNFTKFRNIFKAEFLKGFLVPSFTFDNVKGKFPIGFFIWDLNSTEMIENIECDVFDSLNNFIGKKILYTYKENLLVINWLRQYYDKISERISYLRMVGTDMQNNVGVFFTNHPSENDVLKKLTANITKNNILEMCIYLTIRHIKEQTWLNDRDHFLYPNDNWNLDKEFKTNCLTFALFSGQNQISVIGGTNHWIPFTEQEVDAIEKFESNFMTDFIKGKIKREENTELNLFNSPPVEEWQTKSDEVVINSAIGNNSDEVVINSAIGNNSDEVVLNSNTGEILKGEVLINIANEPPHPKGHPSIEGNFRKRNTNNFVSLPYNPKLKERAKELRKAGNLAEVLFWNEVKNGKFKGFDFDRQKIIGNYIVDFYCSNTNTVVEIDGSSHDDKQEYDAERDAFLIGLGLEVIHISDLDVKTNLSSVFKMLDEHPAFDLNSPPVEEIATQFGTRLTDEVIINSTSQNENTPLVFSDEAKAVFDAGRELWKYYHAQIKIPKYSNEENNASVNASLYDIREYFQGRNAKGMMNSKSDDEEYMKLIKNLRDKLKILAKKIEPKVYEYGFLKE